MARDNRKENRAAAKAAENENKKPGDEYSELVDEFGDSDIEEENVGDIENSEENKPAKSETDNNDDDIDEDASKREAIAAEATKADTNDVDKKKTEEEARVAEEARKAEEAKAAETPEAKAAREAEEAKKAAPAKKAEPTAEEKAAADAAAAKAIEDAKKAEENPQLTDEEAAKLFGDWRGTTEKLLAEHVYKLTEEDVAQLNENPAAYIPKAMARVYLDTISASFQQFVNYLPRMVHQVLEARDSHAKSETDFYSAWPDLAKYADQKKAKETVLRIGGAYRQANPTATAEEWINEVGAQAMVALRIQPTLAPQPPVTPEIPAFKPASNTPASTPPKQPSSNPFASMAEEFLQETVEDVDDN